MKIKNVAHFGVSINCRGPYLADLVFLVDSGVTFC